MSLLQTVQALAFEHGPLTEVNAAIEQVRERRGPNAVSYEVVLPALAPDQFLATQLLQKLTYFLDCRGVVPPNSGGVFVTLFCTDGLYFIEAGVVAKTLAEHRGLPWVEVRRRYGLDGAGDPPLLGP